MQLLPSATPQHVGAPHMGERRRARDRCHAPPARQGPGAQAPPQPPLCDATPPAHSTICHLSRGEQSALRQPATLPAPHLRLVCYAPLAGQRRWRQPSRSPCLCNAVPASTEHNMAALVCQKSQSTMLSLCMHAQRVPRCWRGVALGHKPRRNHRLEKPFCLQSPGRSAKPSHR